MAVFRRMNVLACCVCVCAVTASSAAAATPDEPLPVGAADLPEERSTKTVQPGVTVTTIRRGVASQDTWAVEVGVRPAPDAPAAAINSRQTANTAAATLREKGLTPRVEPVWTPRTADTGGRLGFRVRIGAFADRAASEPTQEQVKAAGFTASAWFTGWDGDRFAPPTVGPWNFTVVRVDPSRFTGKVIGDYGKDFINRDLTSDLARATGATVALNAGFFVFDPAAGAPGDPAGVGVYNGQIQSEATDGRPALVVNANARRSSVQRLWSQSWVAKGIANRLTVDGINRVPGKIRNCGTPNSTPTPRPLHDVTCTAADDTVVFDSAYGPTTPEISGTEVVLDKDGAVTATNGEGGTVIPADGRVISAIGADSERLQKFAATKDKIRFRSVLRRENGSALFLGRDTTVFNGGPLLVRGGQSAATPRRDGMFQPGNPSFYYGWAHKRNPRTFAGIDARGGLVLATVDGRSTSSLGLSIKETADVARALGMREAINLDGGGSTTAVVDGQVVNQPSDATGERPVGDAIAILP